MKQTPKLVLRLGWAIAAVMLLATLAHAQDTKKEKETHLRALTGVVMNKTDDPIPNSVVFLKNTRTSSISSRFTDDRGTYRFTGLDPNIDYEVHAEINGEKSPTKTVSSLDGRKEIVINLKIDRKNE